MLSGLRRMPKRGQVVVMAALGAVAMVSILALAVDGARIMLDQRSLQNAVDGAVLTGALEVGPGTSANQSNAGKDDAIYALEQTLGISFASATSHHLAAGPCSPHACNPPYNNACCTNWVDTGNNYTMTVTTPYAYSYGGSPVGESEAYIHMDVVHKLPLTIGGFIWPSIAVHVQSTARNFAIPYSLFMFKHWDLNDYNGNGSTGFNTDQKAGDNGGTHFVGGAAFTFQCLATGAGSFGYGGDLWEGVPSASATINGTSIKGGTCTGLNSGSTPSADKTLSPLLSPPPVHLPPDPYGCVAGVGGCAAAVNVTVANGGLAILVPTIPADPSQPKGPRYGTVSNAGTLVLAPGVYFFEGSAAGSGFLNQSATATTVDCYGAAYNLTTPTCWTGGGGGGPTGLCPTLGSASTPALPRADTGAAFTFTCPADGDFGVLFVFYPAGVDHNANCLNVNPAATTNYYCTPSGGGAASGTSNQFFLKAGSSVYMSSSLRYHNVSIQVDENHAFSNFNFTASAAYTGTGCASIICYDQIGLGSNCIIVQGNGNISINGAMLAPVDNLSLSGGSGGDGYGQILGYTVALNGNVAINERYNPVALAYAPVIVQ
jgi:Flp pilus assembly protein TadG